MDRNILCMDRKLLYCYKKTGQLVTLNLSGNVNVISKIANDDPRSARLNLSTTVQITHSTDQLNSILRY